VNEKLANEVIRERGAIIDGAIVRVMKTNKDVAVSYAELSTKVMSMITMFKAQPQMIKTRIEALITNVYMRRDEKDRTKFWYVA